MDREVVLKLGVEQVGDVAKPLKDIGRATEEAAQRERRYQEILRGRAQATPPAAKRPAYETAHPSLRRPAYEAAETERRQRYESMQGQSSPTAFAGLGKSGTAGADTLRALAEQQRQESEALRRQQQQEQSRHQTEWQKRVLWQRHDEEWQRRALQEQQSTHLDTLRTMVSEGRVSKESYEQQKKQYEKEGVKFRQEQEKSRLQQAQLLDKQTRAILNRQEGERTALQQRHASERIEAESAERERRERQALAEQKREYNRLPNRLGRAAEAASGMAGMAAGALRFSSAVSGIAQNPFTSAALKIEQIGRTMPGVVGELVGAVFDFTKNINGTTAAMYRVHGVAALSGIQAQYMAKEANIRRGGEFAIVQSENRAAALRGGLGGGQIGATGLVAMQAYGKALVQMAGQRTTWQGERAFEFASQRFSARVGLERAQAEVDAARRTHRYATDKAAESLALVPAYEAAVQRTSRNVDIASRQSGGVTDFFTGATQQNYLRSLEEGYKALNAQSAHMATLQGDINRARESGLALAEKEKQLAEARLGVERAERDILRTKTQRMSGAAVGLAMMPAWKRGMAMQAARMAMQAKDLGALPPFLLQEAMAVMPNTLRKRAEQQGMQMREYKQLQQLGEIDKGDLNAMRLKETALSVKLDITPHVNEKVLAEAVARAVKESMKDLLLTVAAEARMDRQRWLAGQMMQHATGH